MLSNKIYTKEFVPLIVNTRLFIENKINKETLIEYFENYMESNTIKDYYLFVERIRHVLRVVPGTHFRENITVHQQYFYWRFSIVKEMKNLNI